jgi:hypothetical protein
MIDERALADIAEQMRPHFRSDDTNRSARRYFFDHRRQQAVEPEIDLKDAAGDRDGVLVAGDPHRRGNPPASASPPPVLLGLAPSRRRVRDLIWRRSPPLAGIVV